MKDIQILSDCLVKGQHVAAGTTLKDVDTSTAADLITTGRATEVKRKPNVIRVPDPAPVHRDPEPQSEPRRGRPPKSAVPEQGAPAPVDAPEEA